MSRPITVRRLAPAALVVLVLGVLPPAAAAAYWDFQGTLFDYPTLPYDYAEPVSNGGGYYGDRLNRSNCEAKMILRWRSSGSLFQVNIPNGCDNSDAKVCFIRSDFDAAGSRNTAQGSGSAFVNVRVDLTLDENGHCDDPP